MTLGIAGRSGLGPSDAAALVVLARPKRSVANLRIEALRHDLGLSHSAAVRLVDRLQAAGLASRESGSDGRSIAVRLTAAGRREAEGVLAERRGVVEEVLAPLAAD